MPDVVSPAVRSRMMAGIRGRNTKPEIVIRKALHARGYRYRLHASNVPGKPDLVLPKWRAAIFVNGCFWHGHDCHLCRLPDTRREFWRSKFVGNRRRDREVDQALQGAGWRRLTVWECAIRGKGRLDPTDLVDRITAWLTGKSPKLDIRGAM